MACQVELPWGTQLECASLLTGDRDVADGVVAAESGSGPGQGSCVVMWAR